MVETSAAPPSEWCNTADAAAFLGFSVKALESWRAQRIGPRFYRVGRGSIRYTYADLREWMLANPSEPHT